METQIFYWTGVVIWWGLCLAAMGGIAVIIIITPIYAFHRFKRFWWKWYTIGKFADLGWTKDELNEIALSVGNADDNFLRGCQVLLKAADDIKANRAA